jgi:hypothetical protein
LPIIIFLNVYLFTFWYFCLVIQCVSEPDKAICKDNGGTCVVHKDGYYIVSTASVIIGTILLFGFILPQIRVLQSKKGIILLLLFFFFFDYFLIIY